MINFEHTDETLKLLEQWCDQFMIGVLNKHGSKLEEIIEPIDMFKFFKSEFVSEFKLDSYISKQYCWSLISLRLATSEFIKVELRSIMN